MQSKLVVAIWTILAIAVASVSAHAAAGAVYTESNSASGNVVYAFNRSEDGRLLSLGLGGYPTGGTGTGSGLENQGALAIDDANRFLFVVNAGSNTISVFRILDNSLSLVEVDSSNGKRPISVTVKRNVLYVLNNGGAVSDVDSIAGFAVSETGHLTPLISGLRLSGASVGPTQVSFNPDGDLLIVTERSTNSIDVFTVDQNGLASGPNVFPSAARGPFGFAFGKRGQVFVSELAGSASAYSVTRSGSLQKISGPIANGQSATCWLVLSADNRYAWVTNTGSGNVSSYTIAFDGTLSLLNAMALDTGSASHPIDIAVSNDARYIYLLTTGAGNIRGYAIATDGSLTPVTTVLGVLPSTTGLVAR